MLFNRTATVIVGPKAGGAGLDLTGLRVAFNIEKDTTPTPNKASVTISNLSDQTRASIRERYSKIILSVGYESEDNAIIFQGDVDEIEHRLEPPNVHTIITTGDGRAATKETRISLSLEPGCTVGQVCGVVAQRMGLAMDDFVGSTVKMPGGYSYIGPAETALRQLVNSSDSEYSIQGGRIQILRRNGLRPGTGFLISPATGLIGSPERVAKADGKLEKNTPRAQWAFRCLLNPRIQPADRVRISSRHLEGVFRVQKVRHTGDTHGDEWFSECQVAEV